MWEDRAAKSFTSASFSPASSARKGLILAALMGMAILLAVGPVRAADSNAYWIAASGDWSDANNWSGALPASDSNAYVTNGGTATITQPGGTCNYLTLGNLPGEFGSVNMTSGTLTSSTFQYVGKMGTGLFTQSDGNNTTTSWVYLGWQSGASGTYHLSGNACLSTDAVIVGFHGTGLFTQIDGNNTMSLLDVGGFTSDSVGTYQLSGNGYLSASIAEIVGYVGPGTFTQNGGDNTSGDLEIGSQSGSLGTYELSGNGRLTAPYEYLGIHGTALFTQNDGNNTVPVVLRLGWMSGSSGTYQLSGNGQLWAGSEYIGIDGNGFFRQTGGVNTAGYLSIGEKGRYELGGGTLQVTGVLDSNGVLAITDANAVITISSMISIGPTGSLSAVPGSTIHMTGSAFQNRSTDANALAGMGNLKLIYEGLDSNVVDTFEVAGRDLGADANGFLNNFGLAALQLGGDGVPGRMILVDLFDNQPDSNAAEALYFQSLILNPGSEIYLDGLHLYVDGVLVNPGDGDLYGGGAIYGNLPEPATITMLALGGLAILRRKRG